MKKVLASRSMFPQRGTAPESDKRNGRVKFNTNDSIELGDGIFLHLSGAKTMFDVNIDEVITSLNFYIVYRYITEDGLKDSLTVTFWNYTTNEFESLYAELSHMSRDALIQFIDENNTRR